MALICMYMMFSNNDVDWEEIFCAATMICDSQGKTRGINLESLCDITENHTQMTRVRFSM